ncbi:MAG: hypothetical protein CTY19_02725 [Methylomonas sp.]|nr:MAG: hypothetical protein CTY19_02725 [Methylomonas sp.]
MTIFGLLAAFQVTSTLAATVSGGSLILNLDRNALIAGTLLDNTPAPSIYVEEFWDVSAANKTFVELRDGNTPADIKDFANNEISALGLQYTVNGFTIPPNPVGREIRATDFSFDPNNLTASATGGIGLNGAIRFRVDVDRPNNRILLGDMTLEYHPDLEGASFGRSGWLLVNHIGFDADAFELFDVTTQLSGNALTLNGNLGFGWGFDHLGSRIARENDMRIGTFSFQTTVVPVPAALWLFASGLLGLMGVSNQTRKASV